MGILVIRRPDGQPLAFDDGGSHGSGVPRYYSGRGAFAGFASGTEPKPVGARYFPPEPERIDDKPVPFVYGSIWEGGREAYQQKVYNAAKTGRQKFGFSKKDILALKPGADPPTAPSKVVGPPLEELIAKAVADALDARGNSPVGGASNLSGWNQMAAPGRERPDYTIFSWPAATLTDGSAEEIEIDQALSLAGRFGRDFLGAQVLRLLNAMATEHLTITTADHDMLAVLSLASRTGTFTFADPELMWTKQYMTAVTAPTTATSENFRPVTEESILGEPFLYVAPRLFWRVTNNIDASLTANAQDVRISSVSRRLSFNLFIELLERFADVTLI